MTDYAELRAAIDAGPTPGPWRVQDGCSWRRIGSDLGDGDILRPVVNQNDGWPDLAARQETLNYIAAANPSVIRALLAERDALRHALETMVEMVEMNGFGRAYAMNVARAALAHGQGEIS